MTEAEKYLETQGLEKGFGNIEITFDGFCEHLEMFAYIEQQRVKNLTIPDVNGSLRFSSNDIDAAYLVGVFNTSGIDGLAKEIDRIKALGINPHQMIDILKRSEQ